MFIGHFAVGFASKKLAPKTSLGVLMLAPIFLDVLWPLFVMTGIETVKIDPGNTEMTPFDLHDYPYSHSLLMAIVWSVLFAGIYFALRKNARVALLLAAGVFSHWILDFVTHRPDMPLYPGSTTYLGLGLWNSRVATMAVEIPMFFLGVWIYKSATRARDGIGRVAFLVFVGFLLLSYLAAAYGPPPPNAQAIGILGVVSWLFIPWFWWFDKHRDPI